MRPKPYPLATLLRLREQKVDDATTTVATAVSERERARRERDVASQRAEAHAAEAQRARDEELAALGRGELRVTDLAHASAWEARLSREAEVLTQAVEQAAVTEEAKKKAEAEAMRDLASRKAEQDVVEQDRDRFREKLKREALVKEEEEQTEAWRPRRP